MQEKPEARAEVMGGEGFPAKGIEGACGPVINLVKTVGGDCTIREIEGCV